jgi:uncharacterized protein (TIGR03000 family)
MFGYSIRVPSKRARRRRPMIRKPSYLVLPALALVALTVAAAPAAAGPGGGHGGSGGHGGGSFHGGGGAYGGAFGGAYLRGLQPNYGGSRGAGYRRHFGYWFYPYGFGWGYDPFGYGDWAAPDLGWAPPAGSYPVGDPVPPRTVVVSGEVPAALTLEFPAPAEVWVDGTKLPGAPDTVRTVRSPVLPPGERHTFHIKADWTVKGQTYEYHRDTTVEAGAQSRLMVVSGTAVGAK